jgi:hypothetical protein
MGNALFDNVFSGPNGLANTLITAYGTTTGATFTRTVEGAYDPITGVETGETTTNITTEATPILRVKQATIPDTPIKHGDLYTIVPGDQITVLRADVDTLKVTHLGVNYTMKWFQPIASGDLVAAYKIYLRQS